MMFLATLQLGKTGFFGESGWFYLELLVLLFSIGAGVLWLIEKRRHRGEKLITPHNPMGSIPAHLLRTKGARIGKTALILALGTVIGWMWRYHEELTDKVEVLNAVVESQNGLHLNYHYLDDPAQQQHAQVFCSEPANRVPHFKPRQIIASMELARHDDCEIVESLTLRRVNGVAILAGGY